MRALPFIRQFLVEKIYLRNKIEKFKDFNKNMLYKLQLLKMKVSIK